MSSGHSFHLAHHVGHTVTGNHFHHFARLVKLLNQSIYFLNIGTRTFRDTLTAAGIEDFRIGTLLRSHTLDNSFNAFESIIVYLHVLYGFSYSRYHSCQIFQITHLLDLLNLIQEVIKIKFILLNLLLKTTSFFLIKLFLGTFHQRNDVTHSQDSVSHTFRMEYIYGLELLTRTYKLNRFGYDRSDTERRTTTGVAIKFGQNYAIKIESVVKFLCSIYRILTGHRVDNKQDRKSVVQGKSVDLGGRRTIKKKKDTISLLHL